MGEENRWRKKTHNKNNFNDACSMILRSLAARTKGTGANCLVQLSLSMKERSYGSGSAESFLAILEHPWLKAIKRKREALQETQ